VVGKSSSGLSDWGYGGVCSLVSGGRLWQVTPRRSEMTCSGVLYDHLTFNQWWMLCTVQSCVPGV